MACQHPHHAFFNYLHTSTVHHVRVCVHLSASIYTSWLICEDMIRIYNFMHGDVQK